MSIPVVLLTGASGLVGTWLRRTVTDEVAHAPDPHVVRPAASVALLEEHAH